MDYRVRIMPRAERDLSAIYDAVDAFSSDAALIWYRGLRDAIRSLRYSPSRCPLAPEDRALRNLLHGRKPRIYRVIFRILEKQRQVDVLHIRHGARQELRTGELG